MQGRWMYLVAIIDWYSRKIVGYELSQTMNKEFVIKAVVDAVNKHGAPIILNSDQGSQFTSPDYIDTLKGYGIKISMDGKGRALDNAITERFWRTIKWEDIYIMQYETPRALRKGIAAYIRYYNYERRHQSLDGHTPARFITQILPGSKSGLRNLTRPREYPDAYGLSTPPVSWITPPVA